MGRIRTIKPEFHAHEELSALPPETHLLAAALVNYADDEGYFNANPILVKAGTNPLRADATPISEQLHQLAKIGYIEIRKVGDKCFGHIVTFANHQKVSHPSPSKLKLRFEELPKSSGETLELFRPELNGIELNGTGKEEARVVREQPTKPEPPISADMISRGVMSELCISGRDLAVVLDDVCRFELKAGRAPEEIRDAMIAAWKGYSDAKPRLNYPKGAVKFFGEGDWRDMKGWPWKDGMAPPPKNPNRHWKPGDAR